MKKIKLVILKNEMQNDHEGWMSSCNKHPEIQWNVIELFADNWLEQIRNEQFDILALRPPGI